MEWLCGKLLIHMEYGGVVKYWCHPATRKKANQSHCHNPQTHYPLVGPLPTTPLVLQHSYAKYAKPTFPTSNTFVRQLVWVNLRVFWGCAFAEGKKVGQEEEYNWGCNARYNEGYSKACEKDYEAGLAANASVSTAELRTQTTINAPKVSTTDASSQMDPPATTTTSTATQTNSLPTPIIADLPSSPMLTATLLNVTTNKKNMKTGTTETTSQTSQNSIFFFPKTSSVSASISPAPSPNPTPFEMHPETANSMGNHQKFEKSPISDHFSWADDASTFPMPPTLPHPPHNLSCLFSVATHPFSLLQCSTVIGLVSAYAQILQFQPIIFAY